MKIIISNQSGEPIYEQIKNQIKQAIFQGTVKEGELLPSIRQLAKDLSISVITTTRAYNDLEDEGFVTMVQGKGCYVLPLDRGIIKEDILVTIEEHLQEIIKSAAMGGIPKKEVDEMFSLLAQEEDYE